MGIRVGEVQDKEKEAHAVSTAVSAHSTQASRAAVRRFMPPPTRPRLLAPTVTTLPYGTIVSQVLRQPLRGSREEVDQGANNPEGHERGRVRVTSPGPGPRGDGSRKEAGTLPTSPPSLGWAWKLFGEGKAEGDSWPRNFLRLGLTAP